MASSYQTLDNVFADVRYISGKDSTTLVDSDLLRLANKYYLLLVRELVGLNEDLHAEISSTDLVANQREYVLPIDDIATTYGRGLIKMQRIEVNYSGGSGTWKVARATTFQSVKTPTILDTDINAQFSQDSPVYWFFDRSVWLAPVPGPSDDVAAGNTNLYMYWIKRPDELALVTDIPDIPKDFLNLLSEGMLIDVFRKYGRINDSLKAESRWNLGIAGMRQEEQGPDSEQLPGLKPMYKNYK